MEGQASRPGYDALISARQWEANAEDWIPFMRDVLQLPVSMLPAARGIVRKEWWRRARNPLESVRRAAERAHLRKCLGDSPPALQTRKAGSSF